MAVKEILLLGDSRLYVRSRELTVAETGFCGKIIEDCRDTLLAFRGKYGVGRAIAAPQIGYPVRLIYMHSGFDGAPEAFINPTLTFPGDPDGKGVDLFELWDDCMSFPNLLVKLRRHRTCFVSYMSGTGTAQTRLFEGDASELFQHEYDHLDGILAVMRALDGRSFADSSFRGKLPV